MFSEYSNACYNSSSNNISWTAVFRKIYDSKQVVYKEKTLPSDLSMYDESWRHFRFFLCFRFVNLHNNCYDLECLSNFRLFESPSQVELYTHNCFEMLESILWCTPIVISHVFICVTAEKQSDTRNQTTNKNFWVNDSRGKYTVLITQLLMSSPSV